MDNSSKPVLVIFERDRKKMKSKENPVDDIVEAIIFVIGLMGALAVLGYQIYMYLRVGVWYSLSVITALQWLGVNWAFYPTDWLGLYNFLADFPLAWGIFVCAFIPILIFHN